MKFVDKMRELAKRTRDSYARAGETDADRLLERISGQLARIADRLETDVEAEASGRHGYPQGLLEYPIEDSDGGILETGWTDADYVDAGDISATDGFQVLKQRSRALGLRVALRGEDAQIESEESRYRYTVVVSGWGK